MFYSIGGCRYSIMVKRVDLHWGENPQLLVFSSAKNLGRGGCGGLSLHDGSSSYISSF